MATAGGADNPPQRQCAACGKGGLPLQQCPCYLVWYCGKACQLAHWDVHGGDCRRSREGKQHPQAQEGLRTPGERSSGSSQGLTDAGDSPGQQQQAAVKGRTAAAHPGPLPPYQAAVLAAAIERVCMVQPSLVAAMCMELVQRDPADSIPIVTRALGSNLFSPELPPSSYYPHGTPHPPPLPMPPFPPLGFPGMPHPAFAQHAAMHGPGAAHKLFPPPQGPFGGPQRRESGSDRDSRPTGGGTGSSRGSGSDADPIEYLLARLAGNT